MVGLVACGTVGCWVLDRVLVLLVEEAKQSVYINTTNSDGGYLLFSYTAETASTATNTVSAVAIAEYESSALTHNT